MTGTGARLPCADAKSGIASRLRPAAIRFARIECFLGVAELEPEGGVRTLAERHRAIEARAPPGMASAGSGLLHLDPNRILVAVEAHLHDPLHVTGGFALAPQALPRAAEVPSLAGRYRVGDGLRIHVRDHQDLARTRMRHDAGHKAIGIELGCKRAPFLDLRGRAALRKEGLISQNTPWRRSALGPTRHRDEAKLLLGIFTERPGELGRDGPGAGLFDPAHRHAHV